ncbi:hypothetical protein BR93DRAFT_930111 [Coniochaeta sp. PMI_546]|nr:hypothetical protein BR93DRAFT_930111 [Coniochaeta sp. PMI_546]
MCNFAEDPMPRLQSTTLMQGPDHFLTTTQSTASTETIASPAPPLIQDPVHPSPSRPPEERFTHILLSIKQAGFEDIDSMILQYYTSDFRYDSVAHWAQKRSRMERLRPLLAELSQAATSWPAQEAGQYQDVILKIASRVCASDMDLDISTPLQDMSTVHILGDGPC